jgi:hypothetical protein
MNMANATARKTGDNVMRTKMANKRLTIKKKDKYLLEQNIIGYENSVKHNSSKKIPLNLQKD